HDRANPKRVYYLSMEFLIGRSLVNNIINLGAEELVRRDLRSDPRQDWKEVIETEPDAGLGNGGLGRLAACFIEWLATLQIPARRTLRSTCCRLWRRDHQYAAALDGRVARVL